MKQVYLILCYTLLFALPSVRAQIMPIPENENHIQGYYNFTDQKKLDTLYHICTKCPTPEQSVYFCQKSLMLAEKLQDTLTIIAINGYIGNAYSFYGNYNIAATYYFKAAQLAKNTIAEAASYAQLGSCYAANKDYDNAKFYLQKCIEAEKRNEINNLTFPFLLLGDIARKNKNYTEAIDLYNESTYHNNKHVYRKKDTISKAYYNAYNLIGKGLTYGHLGYFNKGEPLIYQGLTTLESFDDFYGLSDFYEQLGNLYTINNRKKEAHYYITKGLEMAKENVLRKEIKEGYYAMYEYYKKYNDPKNAITALQQYQLVKDSIYNKAVVLEMANVRTQFEVSIKQTEISILKNQKKLNTLYFLLATIALLVAGVVVIIIRLRYKNTRLLAANARKEHNQQVNNLINNYETKALQAMVTGQENERKKLAKELHSHIGSLLTDIKVNLNSVDKAKPTSFTHVKNMVEQACTDVRSLSHSLNMGISDDFGLEPALEELIGYLQQIKGLTTEFSATLGNTFFGLENEVVIYRIVQELVSNVLKHAEASKLGIHLVYFENDKLLNIFVEDNGKGFNPETISSSPNNSGLQSLQQMVSQFNGFLSIDSNAKSGTSVSIDIPITIEPLHDQEDLLF